jgi:hypothetical protein
MPRRAVRRKFLRIHESGLGRTDDRVTEAPDEASLPFSTPPRSDLSRVQVAARVRIALVSSERL